MVEPTSKLIGEWENYGGNGHWTPPPKRIGFSTAYHSEMACPDCRGIGMALTGAGEHLFKFLRRLIPTRGI